MDGFGQQQQDPILDKEDHIERQRLKRMFTETLSNAMMASGDELKMRSKEVCVVQSYFLQQNLMHMFFIR